MNPVTAAVSSSERHGYFVFGQEVVHVAGAFVGGVGALEVEVEVVLGLEDGDGKVGFAVEQVVSLFGLTEPDGSARTMPGPW